MIEIYEKQCIDELWMSLSIDFGCGMSSEYDSGAAEQLYAQMMGWTE